MESLNTHARAGNLFSEDIQHGDSLKQIGLDDLGDTMRGLIDNEAGEALYDSSRNLTDKITLSQVSNRLV